MSAKEVKRKKKQLEARNKCDDKKKQRGYIRKSIWVPAQHEENLISFINELNKMHEANMTNKRL
jgi:hypothetical protein